MDHNFFSRYVNRENIRHLFYGSLAAVLDSSGNRTARVSDKKIAIDFISAAHGITQQIPSLGFTRVFGITTDIKLSKLLFSQTYNYHIQTASVIYRTKVPQNLKGRCALITAIDFHSFLSSEEELKSKLFKKARDLLNKNGQFILFSETSNQVSNTPDHFYNMVHTDDIPAFVLEKSSDKEMLSSKDGYISLPHLCRYEIQNGTKIKTLLCTTDEIGNPISDSINRIFWSDRKLISIAKESGLKLECKTPLSWNENFPNAYMMMVFQKTNKAASLALS